MITIQTTHMRGHDYATNSNKEISQHQDKHFYWCSEYHSCEIVDLSLDYSGDGAERNTNQVCTLDVPAS